MKLRKAAIKTLDKIAGAFLSPKGITL